MARRMLAVALAGLMCCQSASAQKRNIIYVDFDMESAKALADRPRDDEREQAFEYLRMRLAETLKRIPHMPCWRLEPLAADPLRRPNGVYDSIKVEFFFNKPHALSSSDLLANVILTSATAKTDLVLNERESLNVIPSGEVESVLGQDWQSAYDQVANQFKNRFRIPGIRAAEFLRTARIPIAYGFRESFPGGAVLPIEFDSFGNHAGADFEIVLMEMMGAAPKARLTSRLVGRQGPYLRVDHRFWDTVPYQPTVHDAQIKQLTATAIVLKAFGSSDDNLVPLP